MLAQLMPTVMSTMRKATFSAVFLISMMLPASAEDSTYQANPIPAPLPETANPEQQVWRWTQQSRIVEPGNFLLALDQPSKSSEQLTATVGIAADSSNLTTQQVSNLAAADIAPDDTRGSITGSLSVPLPIGTPPQRLSYSPTPLSPVATGPIDALGYIGDDGIFHAK